MKDISKKEKNLTDLIGLETDRRIYSIYYNSKKIKYYNNDDFDKLTDQLYIICKVIGISEPPNAAIMATIVLFLKRNFEFISCEEISNAFELAISKKLDVKIEHFGNFNAIYLSNVITAYIEKREFIIVTANKRKKEIELNQAQKIKSPEDIHNEKRELIIFALDQFKKEKYYNDLGGIVGNYIDRMHIWDYTPEQKLDYKNRAKEKIKQELEIELTEVKPIERQSIKDKISRIEIGDNSMTNRIRVEALKMALNDFFKNIVENEIDLISIIDQKIKTVLENETKKN